MNINGSYERAVRCYPSYIDVINPSHGKDYQDQTGGCGEGGRLRYNGMCKYTYMHAPVQGVCRLEGSKQGALGRGPLPPRIAQ